MTEGEEQISSSLHTFSPKEWLIVCHKVRMTKLHIPGIDKPNKGKLAFENIQAITLLDFAGPLHKKCL